jgi:hypothetical protein
MDKISFERNAGKRAVNFDCVRRRRVAARVVGSGQLP